MQKIASFPSSATKLTEFSMDSCNRCFNSSVMFVTFRGSNVHKVHCVTFKGSAETVSQSIAATANTVAADIAPTSGRATHSRDATIKVVRILP